MRNNNTLIKVISFLFPPIGLIIFAINIGKDDILAKMSVKYALLGIVIIPLTIFIILTILYGGYKNRVNETQKATRKIPVASVSWLRRTYYTRYDRLYRNKFIKFLFRATT